MSDDKKKPDEKESEGPDSQSGTQPKDGSDEGDDYHGCTRVGD
jgi:hypothetical protein